MPRSKHNLLIISSVFMMMLMGTVYAYSIFRVHIENTFGIGTLLSGLPYMTSLSFYALSMMVSGRFMKPKRLKKFVVMGTLLIAFGWFLSGLATSLIVLIITYGVMIGTGVGMVYGVPIFMVQKKYPEKSGLMAGIILLGFGMSPLITAPVASVLIYSLGLKSAFMIFGVAFLVLQLPLSLLFKMDQNLVTTNQVEATIHHTSKTFKHIYLLFAIATTIGLMMIGLSYQIGVVYYQFDALVVTGALSFFAVMNGIARPIFGRLMDKKGFVYSVRLSLILMAVASLIGMLNQGDRMILYFISLSIFWFNLGAWLSIVPASIKLFYGTDQYAKRYGVMFTGYGLGAIIGTIVSGMIMDVLKWTSLLYLLVLGLVFISMFLLKMISDQVIYNDDDFKKNTI